ncbi:MAG: hypothetical protein OSB39_09020 [Opitutales bacterium]|nr:hypothetical protein [Opitutales bacterium]
MRETFLRDLVEEENVGAFRDHQFREGKENDLELDDHPRHLGERKEDDRAHLLWEEAELQIHDLPLGDWEAEEDDHPLRENEHPVEFPDRGVDHPRDHREHDVRQAHDHAPFLRGGNPLGELLDRHSPLVHV